MLTVLPLSRCTTCQIYTIRYVEDFWAVYNHIKEAEHIPTGSNYHLFLVSRAVACLPPT